MEQPTTFTLDDVEYDLDSIPDEARPLLQDITIIDQEIQKYQTQISIASVAKNAILNKFKEFKDSFKETKKEEK